MQFQDIPHLTSLISWILDRRGKGKGRRGEMALGRIDVSSIL
jgi:hypothetical protein